MKTNIKKYLTAVLLLFSSTVFSQETSSDSILSFSLVELKEYALTHNYEILNADLEIKKAEAQKYETTAIGLPHVSGSAEYQNFFEIPVQLMPNFIAPAVYDVNTEAFGLTPLVPLTQNDKIPVKFGSKHNLDFKISASQLIFSGEYIVGLKAAKIYLNLSEQAKQKNTEEIKLNIEKTHNLILITEESIKVLDSIYKNLTELYKETETVYKNGFAEETDVEQLKLNMKDAENSLISFKKQRDFLFKLLKFQTGIDINYEIKLTGTLKDVLKEIENSGISSKVFDIYQNTDYKLVKIREKLADLNLQREKTKYLPDLTAFYTYSRKIMQDSLNNIFDTDSYPTSLWGLQLNIPIFSSGQKRARVMQAKFDFEEQKNIRLRTEQAIMLDYARTKTDFEIALNTVKRKFEAEKLAEKIYNNTLEKYRAGTVSSITLTQVQTQYFESLNEYYESVGELTDKYVDLKKLNNKL
ncbi:MAG: TolC family protein [Chlorobi bacterium]|nr:TolC family protein [Chlorobiota bacterium]